LARTLPTELQRLSRQLRGTSACWSGPAPPARAAETACRGLEAIESPNDHLRRAGRGARAGSAPTGPAHGARPRKGSKEVRRGLAKSV